MNTAAINFLPSAHTDPNAQIEELTVRLEQAQSESGGLRREVQMLRDKEEQAQLETASLRKEVEMLRGAEETLKARVAELEEIVKQKDAKVD